MSYYSGTRNLIIKCNIMSIEETLKPSAKKIVYFLIFLVIGSFTLPIPLLNYRTLSYVDGNLCRVMDSCPRYYTFSTLFERFTTDASNYYNLLFWGSYLEVAILILSTYIIVCLMVSKLFAKIAIEKILKPSLKKILFFLPLLIIEFLTIPILLLNYEVLYGGPFPHYYTLSTLFDKFTSNNISAYKNLLFWGSYLEIAIVILLTYAIACLIVKLFTKKKAE